MDPLRLCTTRLTDQNFGMCISPQDILVPFFYNNATNYYRPWKLCEEIVKKDFGSTVDNNKDNFKITLDVQHFRPEEINVKMNDKEVIIEGKHQEREDEHGMISRQFIRRYRLPKDCVSESITSTLSSDGLLSIIAKKKSDQEIKQNVKVVPIKMDGPCRKVDINEEKGKAAAISTEKISDKCEMNKENCEIKKDKANNQVMLKEEHSRLLKPELLGEGVSCTEKLISDSKKETDELLKLISAVQTTPNPTEKKLDEVIGQCKTAIKELKKDKTAESTMSAISEISSMISSEMASMASTEIKSTASSEMLSTKSSMTSETAVEVSMSSSRKASSDICAELKEAAAENA